VLFRRLYWTAYLALRTRGQARYPYQPLEAIKAGQRRNVQRMVSYAYRFVPYYRETMNRLGLRPADFQCADDLAKLPVLERSRLQSDPGRFVSTAQPEGRYYPLASGGSTGRPCTIWRDTRDILSDAAHKARSRAAWINLVGRPAGYRKTIIVAPQGTADWLQGFYQEQLLLPRGIGLQRQTLSIRDSVEEHVAQINAFKPHVLHCYGSYAAMLFHHVEATGEPFHRPKVLLYSSDAMPDSVRRRISDSFGIPVFGSYQATEASNIAFECQEHMGLHQNLDFCVVRIVDAEGNTVPHGESGDVVISNLVNRGTVLLNYRLGDVAAWLPHGCTCGRSLPLLSMVQGRNDEWLELPSGRLLHAMAIPGEPEHHPHVWQYQVVQDTLHHLRVALVVSDECDRQATRRQMAEAFRKVLGEDVTVEVQFVQDVERTPGGKARAVLSPHLRRTRGESVAVSVD
jgi:phenylacetate-CoA ligase